MKIILLLFFLLILYNIKIYSQYGGIDVDKYIQDAEVFEENQLPLLPTLIPFENNQSALTKAENESEFYQNLNGGWKFKFENTPYI